jgi:hypothetical protein
VIGQPDQHVNRARRRLSLARHGVHPSNFPTGALAPRP